MTGGHTSRLHYEIAYGRLATVPDRGKQDNTNFVTMRYVLSPAYRRVSNRRECHRLSAQWPLSLQQHCDDNILMTTNAIYRTFVRQLKQKGFSRWKTNISLAIVGSAWNKRTGQFHLCYTHTDIN
jgi:hypothetical protein